ncbi:MAG: M23 family metallopeptidase [Coriobacteriales bacterium]|jgi:hypothetical protein
MYPDIPNNPFASLTSRSVSRAPHPVTSQNKRFFQRQHETRQHASSDSLQGPENKIGLSCQSRGPILLFAGLLAFTFSSSPLPAYAGWVVEDEPTVLVGFGERYVSELGTQATHHGIDCLARAGMPCLFPTEGTVSFVGRVPAGDLPGCGTTMAVSLLIEDGRTVTLMPLEEASVSVGQQVDEGQVAGTIAPSGDGSAASPHVHVGLKRGRTYYDPSEILGVAPVQPEDGGGDSAECAVPIAVREVPPAFAGPASEAQMASNQEYGQGAGVDSAGLSLPAEKVALDATASLEQDDAAARRGTAGASSASVRDERPEQGAVSSGTADSPTVGAGDAPYERWLSAQETAQPETAAAAGFFRKVLEDSSALARTLGTPLAAGLFLASGIGIAVMLVRIVGRKEADQAAGMKMKNREERAGRRRYRPNPIRRSSTFGELMVMRQPK